LEGLVLNGKAFEYEKKGEKIRDIRDIINKSTICRDSILFRKFVMNSTQ